MATNKPANTGYEVECLSPVTKNSLGRNAKWTFKAKQAGKHVGTLEVTRGSVTWQPRYKPAEQATRLKWQKFSELMQEHGRKVPRKAK